MYRILLFSVKAQHESAIGIHIPPPFWTSLPSPSPSHPSRLIQNPCLSFLRCTANSHWLSILPKNWCFWIVVLEKSFKSPLDCKKVKPVHPKGNQPLIFIERTAAETPVHWLPNAKSPLIGKDPDAEKDWGPEDKGTIEDEMIDWHHWLNRHEFGQSLGDSEGETNLACAVHGVTKSWTGPNNKKIRD